MGLKLNDVLRFTGSERDQLDDVRVFIEVWNGRDPTYYEVRRLVLEYVNGQRNLVVVAGDRVDY